MSEETPSNAAQPPPPVLTNSQTSTVSYVTLAQILRVSVDTLQTWVRAGRIVQPVYFGTIARWGADQVARILAEGTQPVGTYTPADSPRARQLRGRPANATKSLGHITKVNGPTARKPRPAKKHAGKKRRAG